MSWIRIVLAFTLVDNIVLERLLGVCMCANAPRPLRGALGVGMATALFMSAASIASWAIERFVLAPLGLDFLQALAFTAAIAGAAWLIESLGRRFAPALVRAAGFSVRGAAVNCAVLGIALIVAGDSLGPLETLLAGVSAGVGIVLVMLLMSAIRARLDLERVPKAMRGLPASLISLGLLALAFMAFDKSFLASLMGAAR